ncbi:hypothetical protein PPYR_08606 [Photinus pyralis]|uniref:MSP domain-containing protein n=1 Tax=Photinus pyralis TaxID=7054 RepID=A0A5N4AK04_PHOPY|nr:motile sperm domain-containing protein 2-like [Photinus pyralis]KAB0797613.1 hypothetical protein PPYR_08606 [Photinus pyralis]
MTVEVTSKQIQDLRTNFLKELENRGECSVHPDDLERIKSGDEWLQRFLLHHDAREKEAYDMLWEAVVWRKEFKTNEINESNVNLDFLKEGIFFYHGRDKEGCLLFIFKAKKHVKGQYDFEDVKRAVIYWLERMERYDKGKPVSLFFDMEGCGVSTVDMDIIKYIIHVFKNYYPNFLNYIIILEMAWILNALFKVIKTMLPEKAVERIKMIKKPDLKSYVDPDQSLKCWGGNDNYVFVFEPEEREVSHNTTIINNKKVHFADGSPNTETSTSYADQSESGGSALKVTPASIITFVKEGTELVSTLELHNTDKEIIFSYKMKTTSPEKFRVRPSAGCLPPGGSATVSVTLLHGFQLGGLSRDKFLIMSMPVDSVDLSPQELIELWKNTSNKSISEHRLRCSQGDQLVKNGSALPSHTQLDGDKPQLTQISNKLLQLSNCQSELHIVVKRTQQLQWIMMFLVVCLGLLTLYVFKNAVYDRPGFCYKDRRDEDVDL